MSQLTFALTDDNADADRVPLTAEEAFITVMGRDRPGRVCCAGSVETLKTWYKPRENSSFTVYQQQAHE